MKNYTEYTENDFIMDADFQAWIKEPSPGSELYWAKVLADHPHKKGEIDRARALLRSMLFKQNLLPSEKEAMWQEIRTAMQKQKEGRLVFMKPGKNVSGKKMMYAAAAVLLACVFMLSLYFLKHQKPEQLVATEYGEIKRITLPDSSSITLNANSNLKYDEQWDNMDAREVWIKGEAFFSIKPEKSSRRFIVHTDEADIEVLGTEFNVLERDGKSRVSLNTGTIRLRVHQSHYTVLMRPGDIVEIDAKNVHKLSGKVEDLSVWKENKLVFDDTPVSEILTQLKHIYGWEFVNVQSDILKEKLTGVVGTMDQEELLRTLEKSLRIQITREGNTVYISRL